MHESVYMTFGKRQKQTVIGIKYVITWEEGRERKIKLDSGGVCYQFNYDSYTTMHFPKCMEMYALEDESCLYTILYSH